jgi:hypothetical protein
MLLFSWKKLKLILKGRSTGIKDCLTARLKPVALLSKRDPRYRFNNVDYFGDSFLRNPFGLLENFHKHTDLDICEYTALASYRSLAEYRANRTVTLHIAHSTISVARINRNKLLRIEGDYIHFLYEEI